MRNWIIYFALACMAATALLYVTHFFFILNYGISKDSAEWGQFGDYFGGVLNPILSFIAMILLIKSLGLQNEANLSLRAELKNNERIEKSRTFSILFFNIIESQRTLLKNFEVFLTETQQKKTGALAIISIEKEIERLRRNGSTNEEISKFINRIDHVDCIYGLLRSFYIAVKLIADRLSDENGFNSSDRENHYLTLINLTDFAQIRMIIISIQFIDCPYSQYMRKNSEFESVAKSVNLNFDLY